MPARPEIDTQGLHYLLWSRRFADGTVKLDQRVFAEELLTDQSSISRKMKSMTEEGRLDRISRTRWRVANPAIYM